MYHFAREFTSVLRLLHMQAFAWSFFYFTSYYFMEYDGRGKAHRWFVGDLIDFYSIVLYIENILINFDKGILASQKLICKQIEILIIRSDLTYD